MHYIETWCPSLTQIGFQKVKFWCASEIVVNATTISCMLEAAGLIQNKEDDDRPDSRVN